MYEKCLKRLMDFTLSLLALIVLSPIFLILTIIGAIAMRGNPFFVQARPGKKGKDGKERIFKLIKFRTMSNQKDKDGNLLPDELRLNAYGRFLRSTSLDELPELINILVGDMSIVGPRPLLVQYLHLYTPQQRQRHDVRPGLTGLAQTKGRNSISFEERFAYDLEYIRMISLKNDVRIILNTIKIVLIHDGISSETSETMEPFQGTPIEDSLKKAETACI